MNNIKRIRESLGISKAEIGRRINTTRSYINHLEQGNCNLNYEIACAIGHALYVDPILLAGEDCLKSGFKDENVFNLISVILDSKFDDVVIEGKETPENIVKYWILSYLFEYALSEQDLKEIFNFIKYKVQSNNIKKQLRHFDNLERVIEQNN